MDWKVEVMPLPISDIERAITLASIPLPASIHGLQIIIDAVDAARQELLNRGVAVPPAQHYTETILVEGGQIGDAGFAVWPLAVTGQAVTAVSSTTASDASHTRAIAVLE